MFGLKKKFKKNTWKIKEKIKRRNIDFLKTRRRKRR